MRAEPLDWRRIAAEAGVEVVWHEETGSTNDDARQLALRGAAHGTAVFAEVQREGRGRRGAVWESPSRRNLLCSVVLHPSLPLEKWARLTHACALAICEVLEAIPDLPAPRIKWPNDIYIGERKVCGILVESALNAQGGFAVAGTGVNLNLTAADFPAALRDTATSVWLERGGQLVSREDFAVHFLQRLRVQCSRAESDFAGILAECDSRSFLNGKRITLISAGLAREGTADGMGPEGELRIVTDDGRTELVTSADLVRPVAPN